MNAQKKYPFILSFIIIFIFSVKLQAQQDPYLPFAQVMPKPVGGIASVYKNISYPDMAKSAGVQGKVYLLIYINEKGDVDNVKVLKGIGAGCDKAAVNGIKKVKFDPGENNGAPVKVKLSLPIEFKLN